MTMRPRYTYRAKVRDLRALATATARATGLLANAVAPPARALVISVSTIALNIITSHYTDQEPQP